MTWRVALFEMMEHDKNKQVRENSYGKKRSGEESISRDID